MPLPSAHQCLPLQGGAGFVELLLPTPARLSTLSLLHHAQARQAVAEAEGVGGGAQMQTGQLWQVSYQCAGSSSGREVEEGWSLEVGVGVDPHSACMVLPVTTPELVKKLRLRVTSADVHAKVTCIPPLLLHSLGPSFNS